MGNDAEVYGKSPGEFMLEEVEESVRVVVLGYGNYSEA